MRPMKKSIDKQRLIKKTLQLLPIVSAAAVLALYAATFMPLSEERIKRCAALTEHVSYYEICSGGQALARFAYIDDGLQEPKITLPQDSSAVSRRMTTGCFVNKYPLLPSCHGLILTVNPDSMAGRRLARMNGEAAVFVRKHIGRLEKRMERLGREQENLDYYLRIHNVNDDGYNVMADLAARRKAAMGHTGKVLAALKKVEKGGRITIRLIRKYTLLYTDSSGVMRRTACRFVSKDDGLPFCLLQTADRKTPQHATAIYLHQWLMPSPESADGIISAAIPCCNDTGIMQGRVEAQLFEGVMRDGTRHDLPPLLAPDGCALFTTGGRPVGISLDGRLIKPSAFGFAFKNLMP